MLKIFLPGSEQSAAKKCEFCRGLFGAILAVLLIVGIMCFPNISQFVVNTDMPPSTEP
jgi:hypothetical protein